MIEVIRDILGKVHTFDNGVRVYDRDLLDLQKRRYRNVNLHEPEEEKWFNEILQESTDTDACFFDIGAALGYYSILVKKQAPGLAVHAFNPDPYFQKRMAASLRLNGVEDVKIAREALSDKNGLCALKKGSWGDRISHGNGNIPMTTIADYIECNNLKRVFLLKMDIQGEEVKALTGGLPQLSKITWMILGTHGRESHDACMTLLKNNFFEIIFESLDVPNQPDGMIIAKNAREG